VDTKGTHGYDNRIMNMKPFFLARGPDIRRDVRLPAFRSVDIYPLLCELLGVAPAPNNGTLAIAGRMLRNPPPSYTQGAPHSQPAPLLLLLAAMAVCTYHHLHWS
jgi:hypothetical protein